MRIAILQEMRKFALPLFFALAGCTTAEPVPGPTGAVMNQTKCSGSPTGCFKAAVKTCNGPYQVMGSYSKAGGLMADLMPGPITWYGMTYRCGPSDGAMPTFPFRGQQYVPSPVVAPSAPNPTLCTSTIGGSVIGASNQITTRCS